MNAVNPVVAEASTSTFDQIKNYAVSAANYLGRQVQWLASTVVYYAEKTIAYIKPAFASFIKFVSESYDKVREYVIANKEVAIPAGIALVIGSFLALGAYFLLCQPENKEAVKKPEEPKKIFA